MQESSEQLAVYCARFEFSKAVVMNLLVCWDMTHSRLVFRYQRFRGLRFFVVSVVELHGVSSRNTGIFIIINI